MSNPQKQKSGAMKRKEKQEKDEKERRGVQTLYNVGFVKTPAPLSAAAAEEELVEEETNDYEGEQEDSAPLASESLCLLEQYNGVYTNV
jgi:hypothetical protein